MEIYHTRYQARKNKRSGDVVVSVFDGDGGIGYITMSGRDYQIWRRTK